MLGSAVMLLVWAEPDPIVVCLGCELPGMIVYKIGSHIS